MKNKVRVFNEKGIRTAYIGSDHGDENVDEEVLQGVCIKWFFLDMYGIVTVYIQS